MSQSAKQDSRRYEGRFLAKNAPAAPKKKGLSRGTQAMILLLLLLIRLGAEALLVYGTARKFVSSNGLTYQALRSLSLGESISSGDKTLQVVDGDSGEVPAGENIIITYDNGNTIVYDGHSYQFNQDLTTILFLGIDRKIGQDVKVNGDAGQSDVMLLIGMDTKTGKSTVLNISREARAQVDVYSASGNFITTKYEQICLAYAYGDGRELSCENAMKSVSRLLYGLPIKSCIAVDLDGILAANEAVGGVTVNSLIDDTMPDGTVVRQGDRIELHGRNAERYIRTRTKELDANSARMDRQMQYVREFSKRVVALSKQNLTFPAELFSSLSPYMVTDLTMENVTFLSSCYLSNHGNFKFRTVNGTYDRFEGSAIYLLDEIDLFEAMLEVFYLRQD